MTQRDTILPLCKLVSVSAGKAVSVSLARTASFIQSITVTDPSGFPFGETKLYVSSGEFGNDTLVAADVGTSATFSINVRTASTSTSSLTLDLTDRGVYDSTVSGLFVSGLTVTGTAGTGLSSVNWGQGGDLAASGIFTVVSAAPLAPAPYVSVTDLSGSDGYYRVSPPSTVGFYTSGTETVVADAAVWVDTSGCPGIIGAPGTTVVLTLQPSQASDSIVIENQLGVDAKFAVNYGVIKEANPIRDQQFPEVL